jgi:DNA-binding winged helix-turn-helix (wHTH) protein
MIASRVTHETTVEFPPFRLDLAAEKLLRGDRAIGLRRKSWAVLRHLVGRRGFLVTRAELLDTVWQGSFVCDDNLSQSIADIRQALGDSARKPRFVETVYGRGFRFIAAIGDPHRDARGESLERAPQVGVFVGREAELGLLTGLLRQAERGERRVVFVTGEAGIGKTTFIEMFLAGARSGRESEVRIARGQSIEQYGAHEAYLPVLEALERLAHGRDGEKVLSVFRKFAPSWRAQIAPFSKEQPTEMPAVTPERMLREIVGALEALAAERTLVLVLEDLHWSDPSTIDFLARIAERIEPARLLLIATYRPAEASALNHPVAMAKVRLETRGRATELALEELDRRAVADYVAARFPTADSAGELAAWLHERSEGSPFFMVALADQLAASPEPHLPSAMERRNIPQSLRGMIEASVGRLDAGTRRILDAASVAGVRFDARAVAAAVALPVVDAEVACEDLVRRWELLQRQEARDWPDGSIGGCYGFRHSLYQEVLYDRLSPAARREMHVRIGQRLEAGHAKRQGEIDVELALHFERGGDATRAVDYLEHAAKRALGRAAFREAGDSTESALRILEENPEVPDHARRELDLLRVWAVVVSSIDQFGSERLAPVFHRTLEICAAVGSRSELCQTHYALELFHIFRGNREEAEQHVGALEEAARGLGSKYRLLANLGSASLALWQGDPTAARARLEGVLGLVDTSEAGEFEGLTSFGPNPSVEVYAFLAYALWLVGLPDRAATIQEKGLARAERLGNPFTLGASLVHSSFLRLLRGDTEAAASLSRKALLLSTEYGIPLWRSSARIVNGAATLKMHGDGDALSNVREGVREWIGLGAKLASPHYALLAESCLAVGEITEGLGAATAGLAAIAPTLDRFAEAELWRLKGELSLAGTSRHGKRKGRPPRPSDEVEECFQRALEIARRQGARAFELRAATSLAKLDRSRGVRGEAH